VVFPPDLESTDALTPEKPVTVQPKFNHHHEDGRSMDLSLASAVQRHVRFVYEQTNQNQRRTAKLLGISRATLARHLRNVQKNEA
jgi:DNA-binding protein Fis